MKFETFEYLVKLYRPECKPCPHNPRNQKTAISFPGNTYHFNGSYQQILEKLGIETMVYTQAEFNGTLELLEKLKTDHGTTRQGFFGITTINNAVQIADIEKSLSNYYIE